MERDDFREIIHAELGPLREHIQRIDHHITGNGTPERGIIVRMDRLEQAYENGRWLSRSVIATAIGAVAASVVAIFK